MRNARESFVACLMGVVLFPIVIPWGYVWANYVKAPADRWRKFSKLSTLNETYSPRGE